MCKFSNRSTFLGSQACTSGGRWNPPSTDNGQCANGFLRLQQSHRKAEMLQRCFSKKLSPGKTLPLSLWGEMVSKIGFCFYGKWWKIWGKNHKTLCFYWNRKNWLNFSKKKKTSVFAEGWTFFLERLYFTFLFLKCLLRASWKVFLLAWLSQAQAFRGSTQKHNFWAQTLSFGDVFLPWSPDIGLTLPIFSGGTLPVKLVSIPRQPLGCSVKSLNLTWLPNPSVSPHCRCFLHKRKTLCVDAAFASGGLENWLHELIGPPPGGWWGSVPGQETNCLSQLKSVFLFAHNGCTASWARVLLLSHHI